MSGRRKLTILLIGAVLLTILVPFVVDLDDAAGSAPPGDFPSGYIRRRMLTTTTGANAPFNGYSGYTVRVTGFDTATEILQGDMQADGDDLRVFFWNGAAWNEVPREVRGLNTADTHVIFKLQTDIAASSSDDNHYIVYGNPAAGTPEALNTTNVYLWWDDASADRESSYVQGRVDVTAHGGAWADTIAWNASGFYDYDTGDNFADSLRRDLGERDVYVEYEEFQTNAYQTDMTDGPLVRWQGTGSGATEDSDHWYFYEIADSAFLPGGYASHDNITGDDRQNTVVGYGLLGPFPQNAWTKLALGSWGVNPTNLRAWFDGTPSPSEVGGFAAAERFSGTNASAYDNEGAGQAGAWVQQSAGRLQNLAIRRYTDPEPTTGLGAEETPGPCDALTVTTSDPAGQLWFNETVEPDGIPFTTQVNVSASFQTGATPGLSVTNDGTGTCDVTIRLMSDPGTGRSLKFNTTDSAPWPADSSREIPLDPSSVTACGSVSPGGTCDIWLWADYENALSGQTLADVRVETV